ncbi:MAG: VIT domain-containing protein, partial [Ignavibacteria bacterium]|nr:VIT domain-containing protein [Ignavibacteria bacterium]
MKIHILRVFGSFMFLSLFIFATNDLTVKDNALHGSKPGYIEKATLVVEPFGSYVEQSLYIEYSERNQFSSNLLEIVHRFELPKDAVINDMWLWIGDSVMQARMFDTWTARGIYDSIVAAHYDPGFLTKNGSQYEFRIYPLAAGKIRKVKITFIVPTKWYGNQATAELPIKLLLSNNS